MAQLSISGDTSGAVTLAAPSVSGTSTLSLPAVTDTVSTQTTLNSRIQTISASVATNALTITAPALTLDFRSTTATTGTITTVTGTPSNLVVPSGQSFGITTTTVSQRYAVLCFNNAGTLALALSPLLGGVQLDETNFLSPTATTTNTLTTIYSTITASSLAYRVIGFLDLVYVNGTGYTTGPTLVQGVGGQALTSLSSLGYGQTWQNVQASRAFGTTYYNTTGKPIVAHITGSFVQITGTVNGITAGFSNNTATSTNNYIWLIIPPGASYVATSGGSLQNWTELR